MNPPQPEPVAVIDIGSNSIKLLVAVRGAAGPIHPLRSRTIDARISAGISAVVPRLTEAGMAAALEAIDRLLADAAAFAPARTILVATSAVRDSANGGEFRQRVRALSGHQIRILSGAEEANLIGRGLTCDPALVDVRDFHVFDLGGGSLECLAFRQRRIEQEVSLQLGCVRLTEMFVPDPAAPLDGATQRRIAAHTRDTLGRASFRFDLGPAAVAVGAGGTMSTVRSIRAARTGATFEQTSAVIPLAELRALLDELAALPLAARRQIAGLPPARADVFPTALATMIAVAEAGDFGAFTNSVYNLRYGLAADALGV